ncbi:MAG: autorepressor SdpR family transcription factor [Candidatus Gracilibacteria bacterium]
MNSIYKALSDGNRRKILEILKEKDMSVSELLTHFSITQASLSHHLDVLKRANLVVDEKKGQFVFYSLNVSVFEEFLKGLMDFIEKK